MAISGSYNYSLARDDILTEALQIVGVVGENSSPTASQLTDYSRTLNILVKSVMAEPGVFLWKNTPTVIFPVKDQAQYVLKASSGARACLLTDYVKTELNGSHAANATSLTVDSTTGMTAADVIGIEETDSTITWTTISSVDSSTALTIGSGLDSICADNNNVYTYTTAVIYKPTGITNAYLRSDDDNDSELRIYSREEYMSLTQKTSSGDPLCVYVEPKLNSLEINVWPVPSDVDSVLVCALQYPIADFDAATDDMDFPIEWGKYLVYQLAADAGEKAMIPERKQNRLDAKAEFLKQVLLDFSTETTSLYLRPAQGF